jgi:uncharacterized protein
MKKKNPVVHFEMPYEDSFRLAEFYKKTFGWDLNKTGPEMGDYVLATTTDTDENRMVQVPGTINGGFFPKNPKEPGQLHPSVVIAVDNITESIKKINEFGGKVLGDPVEIPGIGQYVSFMDTEGNRVSILQPSGK